VRQLVLFNDSHEVESMIIGSLRSRLRELVVSGVVASLLAASAVTIATMLETDAAGGTASAFVPITPCRLADTRTGANIGTRTTALHPTETHSFAVWGTNGNCTIPTTATGVVANVTAIGATATTFLTIFPSDASRPNTSNLNPLAGSPPTPNQVTVALSAGGAVSIYNDAGTVNLIIDLAGYYTPAITTTATPTPTRRSLTTIDGDVEAGGYSSVAIGFDGNPVISYYDDTNDDLRVAKCANPACTGTPTITTVDSAGSTGHYASIAIGLDGNPVISYWDSVNSGRLRVAKCGNPACTGAATITTIDNATGTGHHTSIAIGVDGNPVISYHHADVAGDLRVAKCANPACTGSATLTTVDSAGSTGLYTSIAVGVDGMPVISYHDFDGKNLRVAKCADPACSDPATLTTVDAVGDTGYGPSITIAADGYPVISYTDRTGADLLRVAKCVDTACANPATLNTVAGGGGYSAVAGSIAIGVDGNPTISYYDNTSGILDLRVAKCANPACSGTSTLNTVDTGFDTGLASSIAIGVDGNPIIVYYNNTFADLHAAKCDNWFCATMRTRSNP